MIDINLTQTSNITLKTKDKYCKDDIQIIQNLEEQIANPSEQTQEFTPSVGKNGISKFTINPIETETVDVKSTEENQVVSASEGKYIKTINVEKINLENKTIVPTKQRQTVDASQGYDGLKSTVVEPIPDEYIVPEGTLNINENGVYNVKDKESVNVEVAGEEPNIIAKNIIENGIYNASDDNVDGFSPVKVSILSSEATPITVALPEVFDTVKTFYYFQINNDRILLSAAVTNIGVWSYTVSTNSWKQLYAEGGNYSAFQLFDDKCFIGSTYSDVSMLVYSYTNDEIIAVAEPHACNTFTNVDGLWYCSSNSTSDSNAGLDVYDPIQNTITRLVSTGYSWSIDREFHNGILIYSTKSNGLYLFEPETNTCTELANTRGVEFKFYLNDNLAVLTGTSSTYTKGLFIYNIANKTVTRFLTNTYSYGEGNFQQVSETQWLVLGKSGIALYDAEVNEVTQLTTETSSNWVNAITFDKLTFITSSTTSVAYLGIYLYDVETQTLTKITETGYGKLTIYNFDTRYVITYVQSTSSSYGILLYDHSTKSITALLETGCYYYSAKFGDTCIFASTTSATAGVWLFDSNTNEVTKIYETTYTNIFTFLPSNNDWVFKPSQQTTAEWQLYNGTTKTVQGLGVTAALAYELDVENGNYVMTGGSSNTGIYFYDSSSKTLTKVITSSSYYAYDTSYKIENGYLLIPGGGRSELFFYNLSDKTITSLGVLSAVGMSVIYDDGETCIFTTNSATPPGLDLFDITTNTITQKAYIAGYTYSLVEENELGALLSNGTFFVQYNKNDKSCKLVGYRFG